MKPQKIAVLDFGSQYTQVIARRVRECNVYSKIFPCRVSAETLRGEGVAGLILSGGPASVLREDSPQPDPEIFGLDLPILGICYGVQLIAHLMGGEVSPSDRREYGHGTLRRTGESKLLGSCPKASGRSPRPKTPASRPSSTRRRRFSASNSTRRSPTPSAGRKSSGTSSSRSAAARGTGR